MELTPHEQFQYKMWEPPQRELREGAVGIITLERTRGPLDRTRVLLNDEPLPHRIVYHSPDGFEWGYGGSGPADLALNILALVTTPKEANRLHQDFKWDVIARIPQAGGALTLEKVIDWVRSHYEMERADTERMAREAEQRRDLEEIARMDAEAEEAELETILRLEEELHPDV